MATRQTPFGSQPTAFTNTQPTQGPLNGFYGRGTPELGMPDSSAFATTQANSDRNAGMPASPAMNFKPIQGSDAPLAGPGYEENWYKKYGDDLMGKPSASEDLYSRGVAASNPYYDFAQQQAIKAINDASAARGGFNSSYTQNLIGKTVADIRGQQAHELGMLAGQADVGKFGRYDRGNDYARGAQRAMENRANRGLDYERDLAGGRAGLVDDFYRTAADKFGQASLAAIEAALKASGLTLAEAQQMMDQATDVGGLISSFYGAGGKKTGGGGGGGGSSGNWTVPLVGD